MEGEVLESGDLTPKDAEKLYPYWFKSVYN